VRLVPGEAVDGKAQPRFRALLLPRLTFACLGLHSLIMQSTSLSKPLMRMRPEAHSARYSSYIRDSHSIGQAPPDVV
jgi:hypothetical protein